jgi:penicillin-binding protein 1A
VTDEPQSNETGPAGTPAVEPPRKRHRIRRFFLAIDAFVDTALWKSGSVVRRFFEGYDAFLRRFRAKGIWRLLAELSSDGLTYGLAGFIVVLAFAQPAFEATRYADWKTTDDFAVTFLDRFGKEIGRRGIVLNDSVPLEEIPDSLVKATLATEDRRFFSHIGIDVVGTFRAMVENARAGGVVQGGSTITQQLAKNLFLTNERSLSRKIKEAYLALLAGGQSLQAGDSETLSRPRLYGRRRLRRDGGRRQFYFNKNVRELTLAESAMLAGLFKAPANTRRTSTCRRRARAPTRS